MATTDALRVVVTGTCPHCRAMLAVNRLDSQAFCGVCGRETVVAERTWSRLLREAIVAAPALKPGVTRGVSEGGFNLQYRRIALECLTCGRPVTLEADRCVPCGTPLSMRKASDTPFAEPELSHFYGEAPARGEANDALAQSYPCDRCGAALPLVGNEQTVECRFCQGTTHVPLRFLYRGHRDLPQPFGLVFASALTAPESDTALGDLLRWYNPATEVPAVHPLGEGRVLIAGERRFRELGPDHDVRNVETRFLLVLESTPEGAPRVVWTRDDLRHHTSEKYPFALSTGSNRLLVKTASGIFTLDARTGDTLRVAPADAVERDVFRGSSVELAGEGRRQAKDRQRLFVGDERHVLAYTLRDDRLSVEVLEGETVVARGEHRGTDLELDAVIVSLAAGRVFVAVGGNDVLSAELAPKLRFERIVLPKERRPARVVAFGEHLARVTDHGGFRVFARSGDLRFDAATLPRTKQKSDTELAKASANAIMAKAMDEFAVVQARQFEIDAAREKVERKKKLQLLGFVLLGIAAVMGAIHVITSVATR